MIRKLFMTGLLTFLSGLFSAGALAEDYQVDSAYAGLRDMVLGINPGDIGINPKATGEVWGVMMETGHQAAVVSLVAIADGTVSLYFSNGGGIIGLGGHDGPKRAARDFLAQGNSRLNTLHQPMSICCPSPGIRASIFSRAIGFYQPRSRKTILVTGAMRYRPYSTGAMN